MHDEPIYKNNLIIYTCIYRNVSLKDVSLGLLNDLLSKFGTSITIDHSNVRNALIKQLHFSKKRTRKLGISIIFIPYNLHIDLNIYVYNIIIYLLLTPHIAKLPTNLKVAF